MTSNSICNIAPETLTLGAVLARGANGTTLYHAELLQGQRSLQVAVKSFLTAGASATAEASFLKEVQIAQLASATCQRACRILGCCNVNNSLCLVMSLYATSAAKRLETLKGPMGMPELLPLAVEILEGLTELHAVNVWHFDLKPANILLDKYKHAYLADFGISYALQTLQSCTAVTSWTGTPHYLVPEQTDTEFGPRGSHTDVWGFATTVLHLATGQLPYHGLTQYQMFTSMMKRRPPAVPDTLPAWLQQLLKQCLEFDVTKRPSVPSLLKVFQQQWQQQRDVGSQKPAALQGMRVPPQAQSKQDPAAGAVSMGCRIANDARCRQQPSITPVSPAQEVYTALLAQLMCTESKQQLQATAKVASLAADSQPNKDAIIAAGALPGLVALLKSNQPAVPGSAAQALCTLACGSQQNRDAIIAAQAVPALVALLRSDQPAVQEQTAAAISKLAADSQPTTDALIAAGALPGLVALLKSNQPTVQQQTAWAIGNLARGSQQDSRDAVISSGALPGLVALLKSDQLAVLAPAVAATSILAFGSQQNKDAMLAAGALPGLVALLRSDQPAVLPLVASAISNLAEGGQKNKDAMIAAGALPALVAVLESDQPADVQRYVALTFCSLAAGCQRSKDAILAAGGLTALSTLLLSSQPDVPELSAVAVQLLTSSFYH